MERYYVVLNRNGSVKPDHVLVAGEPTHTPDGNYVYDWYEGGAQLAVLARMPPMRSSNATGR